jgi:hypothetical protein
LHHARADGQEADLEQKQWRERSAFARFIGKAFREIEKHCRRVMFLSSQTASFIVCEIVRANSNNAAS